MFFFPDSDGPVRSVESRREVGEADLLAFSISFEEDYWRVLRMLERGGLSLRAREREAGPLVLAGGPAVFLNPEPLADFVDLFLVGEAEEMLPEFLSVYAESAGKRNDRQGLLAEVAEKVRGAYVPRFFRPVYDGERQVALEHEGPGPARVERRLVLDLDRFATTTRVLSDEAVFGDMFLVEASRGCQWGCRFCAAGFIYRPLRTRSVERLRSELLRGLEHRRTIGLVGAEMASVPGVDRLAEEASVRGGRLSPSSLKADCVTPRLASALGAGGNRSVTVAPEAGSERLRRVINKNLEEKDILRAVDLLVGEGVPDLKLYFMVGLPTERAEDVEAIVELTETILRRQSAAGGKSRVGRLTVSINPFVPKPWTPFQWEPMEEIGSLRAKLAFLRQRLGREPRVRVETESPREAYVQTLLSRGDRRVGRFLEAVHRSGGDAWAVVRDWKRSGLGDLPPPDAYVHRRYAFDEFLPWEVLEQQLSKLYLWVERRKAFEALETPPCDTSTCTACAAC